MANQFGGALSDQPDNTQFLSPLGFNFGIKKLPTTNYFVQSMNVPVRLGYQINGLVIQYNLPSDTFIVLGCVFYQTDLPQLYWQFFQKKQEQGRV